MTREDPQLKLRISADLRDRIQASAIRNGRSMNAEIVRVLEAEFPKRDSVVEVLREALFSAIENGADPFDLAITLESEARAMYSIGSRGAGEK